jgi:hypothetical protein
MVKLVPLRRNRHYVLFWVGQTCSLIGSQSAWVAYPLLVGSGNPTRRQTKGGGSPSN